MYKVIQKIMCLITDIHILKHNSYTILILIDNGDLVLNLILQLSYPF